MYLLLDIFEGASVRNIFLGIGDLYVTVFGGRNRRLENLLGQGYTYDESMAKLEGITLEGVVITERTAKAVNQLAELGKIDIKYFPLLMHIKELLFESKRINIPWKAFETEYEGGTL